MDLVHLALLLLLGLALGWTLLTLHTAWMLAHPPRRNYAWAVARSLPGSPDEVVIPGEARGARTEFESWTFSTPRGLALSVWDIRGPDPAGPVVILTHGWADSRTVMLGATRVGALLPRVSRLILWDLPGHGAAPGWCGLGEHETGALRALIDRTAEDAARPPLILHGFSLGAVISLRAADGDPRIAAVIAEAPYAAPWIPARNVLRLRGLPHRVNLSPALAALGLINGRGLSWWPGAAPPPGFLPTRASSPTLILLGGDDPISPAALFPGLAGADRLVVPGAGHHNLWDFPATVEALDNLLARLRSLAPSRAQS